MAVDRPRLGPEFAGEGRPWQGDRQGAGGREGGDKRRGDLGMRLDGQLGIPSVSRCLIPPEFPVSPRTSPVHGRRAFLGVPDGAGVAPSPSLPRPRQGHHRWSLGRTRRARVGSLRHTPGLLGSGRNSGGWEAPKGRGAPGSALLCCSLRPGLSFPGHRGTGGLARLGFLGRPSEELSPHASLSSPPSPPALSP